MFSQDFVNATASGPVSSSCYFGESIDYMQPSEYAYEGGFPEMSQGK